MSRQPLRQVVHFAHGIGAFRHMASWRRMSAALLLRKQQADRRLRDRSPVQVKIRSPREAAQSFRAATQLQPSRVISASARNQRGAAL